MARRDSRSSLTRAIGRGSARSGAEHWWAERVSAIALVPLSIWLVAYLIAHMGADYARTIQWLRLPSTVIVMILLLIALFHHTALGLQIIIEDYVHSGMKFAALVAMKLACAALAVAGIVAVLVIAFGS